MKYGPDSETVSNSYSMFLTPITVQDSYLTGFLITLPLLVVVAETAGSLVQTPEAGTESMPPDLADRTLSGSGWMTEELVAASETGFLFGAPEASSLVDTLEAGFLVVASETETLPLGTTLFVLGLSPLPRIRSQLHTCYMSRFQSVELFGNSVMVLHMPKAIFTKRFPRVWSNYEIASRLVKQPKEERKATLLTCLGTDALEIVDGLNFANYGERKDIDVVLEKLEVFCVGETNEIYERYQFNKRDHESGESIDSYVAALRTLARTCNYGALLDSLIRDRMVVGIKDNGTRKQLLQEAKLTLNKCIDICHTSEATAVQLQAMWIQEDSKLVADDKQKFKSPVDNKNQDKGGKAAITCKFRGKKHVKNKEECPAWGKIVASVEKRTTLQSNVQSLRSLHGFLRRKRRLFQLDSGATVNVLPARGYKKVCDDPELKEVKAFEAILSIYNGTEICPLGKRRISLRNSKNNRKYNLEFQIVREENKPVLGASAIQGMELITVNMQNILTVDGFTGGETPCLTASQVVSQFKDVFEGEGMLMGKLHLQVDQCVPPVQLPARKPPVALKEKYPEELNRLVEIVIIAKVSDPTEWISSTVVVMKPNGKTRLCLDPRPLNKALKRNHSPTPDTM
ncbi:hypothetical protein AWC38_SpisGene22240 [Stylophora pistillata]|uniref:Uncharacterized protein n=1 Tax=Stylophora pistillata TaxID=50429 RepID=A0A2B4RA23_STYPI|nr:hypothetical protein AWC38_SpisGene22240 [Stylophora pistillata]